MKWKNRFIFPCENELRNGMIFKFKDISKPDGWASCMFETSHGNYVLKHINNSTNPIMLKKVDTYGLWNMDYDFLKKYFDYVK